VGLEGVMRVGQTYYRMEWYLCRLGRRFLSSGSMSTVRPESPIGIVRASRFFSTVGRISLGTFGFLLSIAMDESQKTYYYD
jgi:hypothetical protein